MIKEQQQNKQNLDRKHKGWQLGIIFKWKMQFSLEWAQAKKQATVSSDVSSHVASSFVLSDVNQWIMIKSLKLVLTEVTGIGGCKPAFSFWRTLPVSFWLLTVSRDRPYLLQMSNSTMCYFSRCQTAFLRPIHWHSCWNSFETCFLF